MISSPLIRPLVAPLVGRRANASGRAGSSIKRSALMATALAISALISVAAPDEAQAAKAEARVVQNAHARPIRVDLTPIWQQHVLAVLTAKTELPKPEASPEFDNQRLRLDRLRHAHAPGSQRGPGLNRGRGRDRLLGARDLAFLNFGSARVLAAQPHS